MQDGATMRPQKETVLAGLQGFAIGTVLVILPSAVVELVFDTDVLPLFVQVVLLLSATATLLACLALEKGWLDAYLSPSGPLTARSNRSEKDQRQG
jgi:hypothetical protein